MGAIKMTFGLFVIVAAVYLGAMLVPPYFENYEFQDAVKNEATLDTYTTKTEKDIRTAVFKQAQDLDIPISEEQIHVQRSGGMGNGTIIIRAPYVVHVDIPGYPMDLHFDAYAIDLSWESIKIEELSAVAKACSGNDFSRRLISPAVATLRRKGVAPFKRGNKT